jgi:hypothetical protein
VTPELERLRAAMAADRRVLTSHLQKLATLDVHSASGEERCALVALTLHQTYVAVENILKRVAAAFEETFGGARWHGDLLEAMSRPTDLRPALLSESAQAPLGELLAFRHYLVHGSVVVSPDAERLAELRKNVLAAAQLLERDLDSFDRHIATLVAG